MHYRSLAIDDPKALMFGRAPRPLKTRRGLVIGGGNVYPELNFTLPMMAVEAATMPEVMRQYEQMITGALRRAVELEADGLLVEFETLPPMTDNPHWSVQVTGLLAGAMERAFEKDGLKSVLRVTPNDTRDSVRPPLMRRGEHLEQMLEAFEGCARAGGELLSIESVGGKELHDEALMQCDLPQVLFSLVVLGARDMEFLWTKISRIAEETGAISAGDTACGFGNTAMVLAEQGMIPRTFAAVVRAVSAVRSLVAYECGAVGPGKDCGYENPILKAITGYPMAMEGKSAACAHGSPVGNIAACACDTWSNESVQNIRLLGGMAPTVSVEQLIYDCRLMNRALAEGEAGARMMQKWLIESDVSLDPQALVLSPQSCITIARAIVSAPNHYAAGRAAALAAVDLIEQAHRDGRLKLSEREEPWLEMMRQSVEEMPDREESFIDQMMGVVDSTRFDPAEYGLKGAT